MRKVLAVCFGLLGTAVFSQELICEVVVNARQTGNENVQVFKTLETQLNEFVNNTTWTNRAFGNQERISCSMVINIDDYVSDNFSGSIQVSSSRPVHNSTYTTPVYNFNDRDFNFQYQEFQNLNYNANQFESNLVSVIAFHIYIILGLDADTFSLNSGDEYFLQAREIVGYSQQNAVSGWAPPKGGDQTRSQLIDNIMSPTYKEFRIVMYDYHRNGLDNMSDNQKKSKTNIAESLDLFLDMHRRRPNSFIQRVFFDAKSDEIQDIFSDGPSVNITGLLSTLTKIAPMYSNIWRNIEF
ncbi:MAG: DUF4835 family protein [Flavobacteriaceae bacterium]|jgi:hypothetical protein|nr:DUF4835 family protein [Flavobacteriaceae bacterium]